MRQLHHRRTHYYIYVYIHLICVYIHLICVNIYTQQVACGSFTTVARTGSGHVFVWGWAGDNCHLTPGEAVCVYYYYY